jgi:hypothetical protein
MTEPEDPRSKIVRIVREAAESPASQPKAPRRRRPPAKPAVSVQGDGNIVGDGNVVALMPRLVKRTVVKTGDGTVTARQKATLRRLIDNWIEQRTAVRRTPMSYAAAWKALNKAMRVNSYHELPAASFDGARAWLRRQLAILARMPSAPKRMPGWRNKQIAAIKARCKNQLGDHRAYLAYITSKFGATSLTQLDDDQLQATYLHIRSRRPR